MHIGITMFATDYAMPPHELAAEAEARGFESLWLPEHTHIPASRKTPYPAGTPLPEEYWHTLDPFGALCAAAAVTKTIKLATGICLLIERDTIVTAKEAATVDHISSGRFLFGIGGGWNVEEMENHGTAFKTRFKKMKEQVAACRAIWTEKEAAFHGQFVNFDPIWSYPKPVQARLPVIIGGLSMQAIDRALDYGDGWMPIDGGLGPDRVKPLLDVFEQKRAQKGRARESVPITMYSVPGRPEFVDGYRQLGVERIVFMLRPQKRDEVLPRLDRLATLIA
jgi:probable F420-dependent oxidoreductase